MYKKQYQDMLVDFINCQLYIHMYWNVLIKMQKKKRKKRKVEVATDYGLIESENGLMDFLGVGVTAFAELNTKDCPVDRTSKKWVANQTF